MIRINQTAQALAYETGLHPAGVIDSAALAALVPAAGSFCFETHAAQPEGSGHGLRAAAAGAESSNAEVVTDIMTEYRSI